MAGVFMRGLRYCANTEPYLVACGFALVGAAAIPVVVLPYRKANGGDTFVNDHDLSHPVRELLPAGSVGELGSR